MAPVGPQQIDNLVSVIYDVKKDCYFGPPAKIQVNSQVLKGLVVGWRESTAISRDSSAQDINDPNTSMRIPPATQGIVVEVDRREWMWSELRLRTELEGYASTGADVSPRALLLSV